ncbi:MAG: IS91 family transposase, partial [bacterium]
RGTGSNGTDSPVQAAEQPRRPCHVAMRWAQRLKRVFGIEIEACARWGARLKIVASIEGPGVIARILAHRDRPSGSAQP